jgi:hypothetical protein
MRSGAEEPAEVQAPQGELWATEPPHDEFCQAPAPEEYDRRLAISDLSD